MSGWIKVHRQLQLGSRWLSEPFTTSQAWIDLMLLANHKDGIVKARGINVDVPRGSVGWSKPKLADRWQWSRGKVNRFLDALETEGQIVQAKGQSLNVITLCNYDKFNPSKKHGATPSDTTNDTQTGTQLDTHSGTQNGTRTSKNRSNEVNKSTPPHARVKEIIERFALLGHNELTLHSNRKNITQIQTWIADEVTDSELDAAVPQTESDWHGQGNTSPVPLGWVATTLKSNRSKGRPISAGKKPINTHSNFDDKDYEAESDGFNTGSAA